MTIQTFPDTFDSSYLLICGDTVYVRVPKKLDGRIEYTFIPIKDATMSETLLSAAALRAELFKEFHGIEYCADSYHKQKIIGKNNKSGKTNVLPYVDTYKLSTTMGYVAIFIEDGKRKRQLVTFKDPLFAHRAFIVAAKRVDAHSANEVLDDQEYLKIYRPIDWDDKIAKKRQKPDRSGL